MNTSTKERTRIFDNRSLAKVAVFAALISVLSFIRIAVGPVPISLENLAVMLAGVVLGPWLGALSVILLLALTALGLPLLGGNGGLALFVSPTAGYLLGFVIGAFVIGLISHSGKGFNIWKTALACLVGGMLIPYIFGIPVTALVIDQPIRTAAYSALVFIPGDIMKIVVATLVTSALWKAYPAAFAQK
ncbi:biotin transporter BioY [Bifidobacterium aquikefiri]|uniref:biotin transporter BioY n=1 Tax=Bifidobacterium aquikefiri TaxID=1653207 RepID=UPI0023F21A41|nr:biotin transporter BioY [Bifidobacterium aquikefiri]